MDYPIFVIFCSHELRMCENMLAKLQPISLSRERDMTIWMGGIKNGVAKLQIKNWYCVNITCHFHFVSTIYCIMETKLKSCMIAVFPFEIFVALKRAVLLMPCYESWCSKCPPSAFTQALSRTRHCLTAVSTMFWLNRLHSSTRRTFRCSTSRIWLRWTRSWRTLQTL